MALLFEYESALKAPESGITLPHQVIDDVLDYLAATGQWQEIFIPVAADVAGPDGRPCARGGGGRRL